MKSSHNQRPLLEPGPGDSGTAPLPLPRSRPLSALAPAAGAMLPWLPPLVPPLSSARADVVMNQHLRREPPAAGVTAGETHGAVFQLAARVLCNAYSR